MEFEIHITLDDVKTEERNAFVSLCESENTKPIMIVLDKGDYIHQPMLTGVIERHSFQEVQEEMDRLSAVLEKAGFSVVRKKAEIFPKDDTYFNQPMVENATPYFEWHGKVQVDNLPKLKSLCEEKGGHISRNSLNADGKVRFVTVREYKSSQQFYNRVKAICQILHENEIPLLKQQHELCVYDSREHLDNGWISQEAAQ